MKTSSRRQFLQQSVSLGGVVSLAVTNSPTSIAQDARPKSNASSGMNRSSAAAASIRNAAPPMIFEDVFAQRINVAWRIEQGKFDPANPLMEPAYPWDSACPFNNGTILKDPIDGLWKCWGLAFPDVENFKRGQFYFRTVYATSEDGRHWTRPMLDGFPCMGRARSNVLLDVENYGRAMTVSVLVHPDAEPDRRYELFVPLQVTGHRSWPNYRKRIIKGLPVTAGHEQGHPDGIYRFFSADGIHWKPVEGPIAFDTADSIYFSKEADGPYLAYHKIGLTAPPGGYVPYDVGAGEQRILVRRESLDGSRWSPFELQIKPDWRDSHDTQFMDISPLRQGPGYVAIVAVFHSLNQMMDLQFAGSRDGKKWFRPFPRVACLSNPPLGDHGGGLFYNAKNMVEDGDFLYHYYSAIDGLHGDVYGKLDDEYLQYGSLCRASWEKGRLWAVVPAAAGPTEAALTTLPLTGIAGKQLIMNVQTTGDGQLTAELLEAGRPLNGFSQSDGRVFQGNSKFHTFTWKGGDRCPQEGLSLRFRFRRARLYGFEWRS